MLTQKNIRVVLRWTHIVLGLIIMCYIYSPFHRYVPFQLFVKCFVIPVITFSGIWLWKSSALNRFFGIK